jgi:hypothetical protein
MSWPRRTRRLRSSSASGVRLAAVSWASSSALRRSPGVLADGRFAEPLEVLDQAMARPHPRELREELGLPEEVAAP